MMRSADRRPPAPKMLAVVVLGAAIGVQAAPASLAPDPVQQPAASWLSKRGDPPCPGPTAQALWATVTTSAEVDQKLAELDALKKGVVGKPAGCLDVIAARGLLRVGRVDEALERLREGHHNTGAQVRAWVDLLTLEALAQRKQADGTPATTEAELARQLKRLDKDALRLKGKAEKRVFDALALRGEVEALLAVAPESAATHEAAQRLLKAQPQVPEALVLVSRALPGPDGAAARNRLLVHHPEHPAAMALEPADPKAFAAAPFSLNKASRVERVEQLLLASRMERALAEVMAMPTRTEAVDVPLEVARIRVLVRNDRAADAVKHAEALVARSQALDLLERHAWALGKADRPRDASQAYLRLMEAALAADDAARAGDACFFAGYLLYESALDDEAIGQWDRCRASGDPPGALVGHPREADAVWYSALGHLIADRPQRTRDLLQDFETRFPAYDEPSKIRYWRAVAKLNIGPNAAAEADIGRLMSQDSLDYYWVLARRTRSQKRAVKPVQGRRLPHDALLKKAATDRLAVRTRLLHHQGFQAAARASLRDRRDQDARTLGLAQQIGAWDYAYRRNLRVRPPTYGKAQAASIGWRASYPRPWADLVDKACAEHRVNPHFVYAIMRTESAFDPDITSRVGARGLLQLMPYTARGMAEVLGTPPPDADALYRPEVVIPLGVAFLATSERELGSAALSAAAYNGGPRNVARWMKHFGHLPPELFIERIAFKETRNYVKRTAVTAMMYAALEGEQLEADLPTAPVGAPPAKLTFFDPSNNE